MLRKPELYNKAVTLRHRGFSYNEIRKHVSVGHGTISRWCHTIKLTEEQRARLIEKQRCTSLIQSRIKQAIESKEEARRWAAHHIPQLSDNKQLLLISGILLYWAEGTKLSNSKTGHKGVQFTNTDPRMIKIMMKFFREILRVPERKLKVIVRIGSAGNVEQAQKYWSQITSLPLENFRRAELLALSERSRSLIKYPYGMCRVAIHDILMARKVANLIEEFYKNFSAEIEHIPPHSSMDRTADS